MRSLIVVEHPKLWPLEIPDAEVVSARQYLTDPGFVDLRHARVFNLCRSYAYQSVGYYVSLLAAARGHRPLPSITRCKRFRTSRSIWRTRSRVRPTILPISLSVFGSVPSSSP